MNQLKALAVSLGVASLNAVAKPVLARSFFSLCLAPLVLLLALVGHSAAQSGPVKTSNDDFRFNLTPYAWLTGLSGTVGARGFQTHVNTSFADLSKYLNLAAMIHADVLYRETVGVLADFNYAQLGDQASGKHVSFDATSSLILSDVAAYYRLGTASLGKDGGCPASFDLLAGARIWSLGMRLNTESALTNHDVSKQITWADPIVGARALLHLNEKWLLDFRGGVGGFGVSSAFTWDAMALLGYSFWDHVTVLLGYRAVGVDRDQQGTRFDMTMHGPILGLACTF